MARKPKTYTLPPEAAAALKAESERMEVLNALHQAYVRGIGVGAGIAEPPDRWEVDPVKGTITITPLPPSAG
jgi:hypothetical protein